MDLNELGKNPEQIKQLIGLLQQLLPDHNTEEPSENTEEFSPVMRTKGQKSRSKTKHTNKFLSMREKDMHKDDTKIDKLLCQSGPVARTRDFSMIKVTCRVCGKTEEINPSLLFEAANRYKCNNCSTSAG
jgi:hypothetical protein